jgi:pyruvate formate lyase activating enzyme
MLHDHKPTDPDRHKEWCGVDNSRILENFKKAYERFPQTKFIARTPVIPGVDDDEAHIRAVLAFMRPHKNVTDYELLPYQRFGLRDDGLYLAQPGNPQAAAGDHRRGLRSINLTNGTS